MKCSTNLLVFAGTLYYSDLMWLLRIFPASNIASYYNSEEEYGHVVSLAEDDGPSPSIYYLLQKLLICILVNIFTLLLLMSWMLVYPSSSMPGNGKTCDRLCSVQETMTLNDSLADCNVRYSQNGAGSNISCSLALITLIIACF